MSAHDLVQLLEASGMIDADSISRARGEAVLRQRKLAEIIVDLGLIHERALAELVERDGGVPFEHPIELEAARRVAKRVPTHIARRHEIVPIREAGEELVVAAIDPFEPGLEELLESTTGSKIRIVVGLRSEVEGAVLDLYGADEEAEITLFAPRAMSLELESESDRQVEAQSPDDLIAGDPAPLPDELDGDDTNRTLLAHPTRALETRSDDSTAPTVVRESSEADRVVHIERQLLSVSRALALIQARLDSIDAKIADLVDWTNQSRNGR